MISTVSSLNAQTLWLKWHHLLCLHHKAAPTVSQFTLSCKRIQASACELLLFFSKHWACLQVRMTCDSLLCRDGKKENFARDHNIKQICSTPACYYFIFFQLLLFEHRHMLSLRWWMDPDITADGLHLPFVPRLPCISLCLSLFRPLTVVLSVCHTHACAHTCMCTHVNPPRPLLSV